MKLNYEIVVQKNPGPKKQGHNYAKYSFYLLIYLIL